jgi:hypothetical protein
MVVMAPMVIDAFEKNEQGAQLFKDSIRDGHISNRAWKAC